MAVRYGITMPAAEIVLSNLEQIRYIMESCVHKLMTYSPSMFFFLGKEKELHIDPEGALQKQRIWFLSCPTNIYPSMAVSEDNVPYSASEQGRKQKNTQSPTAEPVDVI